jgi:metal-responsive CopG/Arc/MetJ family transcriptional regulator
VAKNTKINVMLPNDIKDYFDNMARELGITRNAIIVMALKQYIEQQKTLNDMSGFKQLFDKLNSMNLPPVDLKDILKNE